MVCYDIVLSATAITSGVYIGPSISKNAWKSAIQSEDSVRWLSHSLINTVSQLGGDSSTSFDANMQQEENQPLLEKDDPPEDAKVEEGYFLAPQRPIQFLD